MPSTKQGGGYTLTFSKENQDVKDILDKKKENKIVVTKYVCECVRFFEKYKDTIGAENLNLSMVEDLVNKKIELLKKEMLSSTTAYTIEEKENNSHLENMDLKLEKKVNIDDD